MPDAVDAALDELSRAVLSLLYNPLTNEEIVSAVIPNPVAQPKEFARVLLNTGIVDRFELGELLLWQTSNTGWLDLIRAGIELCAPLNSLIEFQHGEIDRVEMSEMSRRALGSLEAILAAGLPSRIGFVFDEATWSQSLFRFRRFVELAERNSRLPPPLAKLSNEANWLLSQHKKLLASRPLIVNRWVWQANLANHESLHDPLFVLGCWPEIRTRHSELTDDPKVGFPDFVERLIARIAEQLPVGVTIWDQASDVFTAADECTNVPSKRPKRGWWPPKPPDDDWYDKPLMGTQKELARCIGHALRKKPVDVKTLRTMHGKSVWMFRVTETSWQAYFKTSGQLAEANGAQAELRNGTPMGADGNGRESIG